MQAELTLNDNGMGYGWLMQELEDRAKFLDALVEKYAVERPKEPPLVVLPPLPEDEAIRCIQVRGYPGTAVCLTVLLLGELDMQAAERGLRCLTGFS